MTPIEDTMIHAAIRFLNHHSTAAAAVLPLPDGKVVAVGTEAELAKMIYGNTKISDALLKQVGGKHLGWVAGLGGFDKAMEDMAVDIRAAVDCYKAPDIVQSAAPSIASAVQQLQDACYGASSKAGWWKPGDTENPLMFSSKLCLIHSEISEAMEGDRKKINDDHLKHRPMREVELADALIRICDLAGAYGMDLGGAVAEKMEYNRTRKDHQAAARNAEGGKAY